MYLMAYNCFRDIRRWHEAPRRGVLLLFRKKPQAHSYCIEWTRIASRGANYHPAMLQHVGFSSCRKSVAWRSLKLGKYWEFDRGGNPWRVTSSPLELRKL